MLKLGLEIGGAVAGMTGFVFSVIIYRRQESHLKRLQEVAISTHAITEGLFGNKHKAKFKLNFFGLAEGSLKRFKCFFPACHDSRPMSMLVSGDYHALHVLQSLLGSDKLDLCQLYAGQPTLKLNPEDPEDLIYLCTPQVNDALRKIAPMLVLTDSSTTDQKPAFGEVVLPCWFANKTINKTKVQKVIWIRDLEPMESPAEYAYLEAADREDHASPYVHPRLLIDDYAIVLRLTIETRKHIVIAGIHQYGTWIGAEFLSRMALDSEFNATLAVEERDFLAVIVGTFNTAQYNVTHCGIHSNLLWILKGGVWVQNAH